MALDEVDWYIRKLSFDDVLYHGSGMDAVLLFPQYPGRFCRGRHQGGRGRILPDAGQCAGDGAVDVYFDRGGLWNLLVWDSKRD